MCSSEGSRNEAATEEDEDSSSEPTSLNEASNARTESPQSPRVRDLHMINHWLSVNIPPLPVNDK